MELQTRVGIERPRFSIDYGARTMMVGSCFTENIGHKLAYFKFQVDINPFGIVYNPFSVASCLESLIENRRFVEADLLKNNDMWVSLYHHGRFSSPDMEQCLQQINERSESSSENLRKASLLVITWGTAWVYRHRASNEVVSNCHKFPASDFERFRLMPEDIVQRYLALIEKIKAINPDVKFMFTISPIRHWKDGAHGNQLSKSVLLLALDELQQQIPEISYFPSYEIVMDELRDYRFYDSDMLHISPQAIEYIWEKFCSSYISEKSVAFMKRIDKLNKRLLHRPLNATDAANHIGYADALEEMKKVEEEIKNVGEGYSTRKR